MDWSREKQHQIHWFKHIYSGIQYTENDWVRPNERLYLLELSKNDLLIADSIAKHRLVATLDGAYADQTDVLV